MSSPARSAARTALLALAFLLILAPPAHAYIDPGAGSLVIQVVIAAVAGAMFKLRAIVNLIRGWLRKQR